MKEEEDSEALKIAWKYQYEDSDYIKKSNERLITETRNSIEMINSNGKPTPRK